MYNKSMKLVSLARISKIMVFFGLEKQKLLQNHQRHIYIFIFFVPVPINFNMFFFSFFSNLDIDFQIINFVFSLLIDHGHTFIKFRYG